MFLPLTDLVALLGIDLVLCAGCLRLLSGRRGVTWRAAAITAGCFVLVWVPLGAAHLPLLAYIRGIISDLSITLVALACLDMGQRLWGVKGVARLEKMVLKVTIALSALFLYPTALGWGDWDAYRVGWGSYGLWLVLLALCLLCWIQGLRLLPVLVGLSLLAWSAGLMESTNLWDYLMDPWLAMTALFQCLAAGAKHLLSHFRLAASDVKQAAS